MLVVKENRKLQHATETYTAPDGTEHPVWFIVRLPLSVGDLKRMNTDAGGVVMSIDLATEVIKEWSYPDPLSAENIERLDLDTFLWLSKEISEASGVRSDEEKNASGSSSSPTTEPGVERSPVSSGI